MVFGSRKRRIHSQWLETTRYANKVHLRGLGCSLRRQASFGLMRIPFAISQWLETTRYANKVHLRGLGCSLRRQASFGLMRIPFAISRSINFTPFQFINQLTVSMVFLLMPDVFYHIINTALTDGKCPVGTLPFKTTTR